jgi:4-hydroxy-3-polyprenylbenzoate decarboxylase
MQFEDLREYIKKIEEIGELKRIDGADPLTEIGPITEIVGWTKDHPCLLFDNIKGYPKGFRIITLTANSNKREQLIWGFPNKLGFKDLILWWKNKLDNYVPFPPKEVSTGPVMENIQNGEKVDLLMLPAPLWHLEDAAPYLVAGGVTILKDPDTGRLNLGSYRGMVFDKNTLVHYFAPGHDAQVIRDKYHHKAQSCPIVVCMGFDPSFLSAAAQSLDYNMSEYEYGGFMRGAPYKIIKGPVTGLPFPSTAEVVLEGEIPPPAEEPKKMEGPFGEGGGYYSFGVPQPVVKIKALYYRNDPIIIGEPTFRFKQAGSSFGFSNAAGIWHRLEKSVPGIKGIAQVGLFLVISIKQYYSGHALRVADLVMSGLNGGTPPRYLVIVDDDIDPSSRSQVDWAINTRVDPAVQINIQRERLARVVIPAGMTKEKREIEDYGVSTVIIDACKPFPWRKDWDALFKTDELREEPRKRIAEKWEPVLGELITKTMPK